MSATALDNGNPAALRPGAFGNAVALSCRECGARQELGPYYACAECFGPLEVAYDFGAVSRDAIEAGPKSIWRYRSPRTSRARNSSPSRSRSMTAST